MVERSTDVGGNIGEGFILVGPTGHGSGVSGQGMKTCDSLVLPFNRAQQNRDNQRLASIVAFQRAFHFDAIAVAGGQEIGADEQENQRGAKEFVNKPSYYFFYK
ncbi:MAG TPA: hypothetical protein VFV38_03505 [Ktedonobacteraceae bacterium]|nr:hypothetical protein [Ktedonobacteraceae bacterium]